MLERVADLTWKRPKTVLVAVVAFVAVAAFFGHDVERHLKAAGFTDSASESERATEQLRNGLGYDATPGIVVLVRAKDGGRLDVRATGGPPRGRPPGRELRQHQARRAGWSTRSGPRAGGGR